jgi:hypothetical protein
MRKRTTTRADLVSCELTTRTGPIGSNEPPRPIATETGGPMGVPSTEMIKVLDQALAAAAYVAGDGMVTEVRLLIYPTQAVADRFGDGQPGTTR